MFSFMKNKIIVILGPTASGKTDLSIKLAKKFNGEIISADSRQVYKGLDIGSGKIPRDRSNIKQIKTNQKRIFGKNSISFAKNSSAYIARGIPHYLLDVTNPKRKFTVAQFQKLALKKIYGIQKRGKLPFLVGGTGFYIQSVVDGLIIPEVKPNWKLRKILEKKSVAELFLMLKKLDPARAKTIDPKNPRRLIRAIEIAESIDSKKTGGDPTSPNIGRDLGGGRVSPCLDVLQIGIKKSPDKFKEAIYKRLQRRLHTGMIDEVKKLHRNGLSWKRLEELGLEYCYVAQYLQGKINYKEMKNKIQKESEHFAKRQMTWFKRDKRIIWMENYKQLNNLIQSFLKH